MRQGSLSTNQEGVGVTFLCVLARFGFSGARSTLRYLEEDALAIARSSLAMISPWGHWLGPRTESPTLLRQHPFLLVGRKLKRDAEEPKQKSAVVKPSKMGNQTADLLLVWNVPSR